ncbi:MAG: TonB-dependent receptor [Chitinophagaceae bacterium]|nr:TonB-dependent receptor [Chitinophagaceae bacterium]
MIRYLHLIHRRTFLAFSFFIFSASVAAQDIPVTFKIINQKKEPVTFATISITNRADSNEVIKKSADSSGLAKFSLVKGSQYSVRVTSVNYQAVEKKITLTGNQTTFTFFLEPVGKTLDAVVITSQRPMMKQEDDKTIVDPENLVASSTSGYEVIEKTPGLFVDQDGNIYISSLSPAAVQINGRDMKMSASDIATMLKSLPPNSISKIEIVRTPSAKYDASSSGGVVNVVLKKGVKIGMTGSINAGLQQGRYGNQFIGFNLSNNDGKKSSYLNVNYSRRNSYEQIKTDRLFAPDSVLSQDALTKYPGNNYYAAYGLTYELTKKWEITYDASLSYNQFENRSENNNIIKKISSSQVLSSSLNGVTNDGSSLTLGTGVESKFKIDSLGSEWTNDTWYSHSINKSDQSFFTRYTTPLSILSGGDGKADNTRDYINLKSDLKLKMAKKFTMETGLQVSINNYRNETNYFRESNGTRKVDSSRTNTFRYNENINALYLQGSKTIGKDFVVKFGSRLENTNMKGRQIVPGDTSFSIQRTDLFPYIYLSKGVMKIAGYDLRAYLVYRRTIRRPYYDQLNPFSRYVDEYLSETGNPSLRPQFTQNFEANISVDERPIFAIGVNDTKDIFTNVVYQSDTSQSQAYRTYDNLGKNKEWYFRGLGALPPGGRYFFVLGAQYNHNLYNGLYENKPLSFKRGSWTFFTYQTFRIDKRSVITMNGFLRLKGQQQFYELTTFGALNTSVNRKFLKDKLIVTASLNDMFFSNKNNFSIRQGSVDANGFRQADTRRFGINLRYNFGIRKKEDNNGIFNVESPERTN